MNTPSTDQSFAPSRRWFFRAASVAASAVVAGPESMWALAQDSAGHANGASPADRQHMRELAAWTALTFDTPNPVPYGADILDSRSGERLMRAANAVGPEHDPSAHAELRTIRLACAKLASGSLKGYTLYTTCEPCPMCMACALWAGMDRVVYGATIADASKTGHQIHIPAKEVARHYDLPCVVDGPVEHEACAALFTDPRLHRQKPADR